MVSLGKSCVAVSDGADAPVTAGDPIRAGERAIKAGGCGLGRVPKIKEEALSMSTDIGSKYANWFDQRSLFRDVAVPMLPADTERVPAIWRDETTFFSCSGL
jgi:hypothetical protein